MKAIINGVEIPLASGTQTKPITKSEYDSLPEQEKNADILYAITDDNAQISGGTANNVNRNDVYSTEETRIGTWIDGKPLYRKTFLGRTASTLDRHAVVADISSFNIETIVTLNGMVQPSAINDSIQGLPINFLQYNTPYGILTFVLKAPTVPSLSIVNMVSSDVYYNLPLTIIFEYTKTTDTAPTTTFNHGVSIDTLSVDGISSIPVTSTETAVSATPVTVSAMPVTSYGSSVTVSG